MLTTFECGENALKDFHLSVKGNLYLTLDFFSA